jgi:hypothetical protein
MTLVHALVFLTVPLLGWMYYRLGSTPRRAVPVLVREPVMTKEPWETDAASSEEWKNESEPDPEPDEPIPNPVSFFEEQRRYFLDRERARSTFCPKCAARNDLRKKQGLEPIPGSIRVRPRDLALYCRVCNQGHDRMSEDTVMRFDQRWHWKWQDSPAKG